jgi:hypothetical protein
MFDDYDYSIDYTPQESAYNAHEDLVHVLMHAQINEIEREQLTRALSVLEGIYENV